MGENTMEKLENNTFSFLTHSTARIVPLYVKKKISMCHKTMKQTKNKDGMGMTEKKFEFHEEELIGEGYKVTSGLLIETEEKIFSTKEMDNLVDKKILSLLYFLAKDKKTPEEEWFTAKDFGHHAVYSSSGKEFDRDTINNSLKRLVKANLVEQKKTVIGIDSHRGYRLKEFKSHDLM